MSPPQGLPSRIARVGLLERVDAKLAELRRVRRDVAKVLEASHAGHCEVATAGSADQSTRPDLVQASASELALDAVRTA